jgi:hypothetical protein
MKSLFDIPRPESAIKRLGGIADRRRTPAMATREARHQLYEALTAHKFELEIIRGLASGPDLEVLDRRIEAARLLLEWIARALELEPPASP